MNNSKEYVFTSKEIECVVDALLIMQADPDTTSEGVQLCKQILAKI